MPRSKPLPAPQDAYDEQLLADIREHGYHLLSVNPDAEGAGFTFTIGLFHNFDHPELLLVGLPNTAARLILTTFAALIRTGRRFETGTPFPEITPKYPLLLQPFDKNYYRDYLGYALWLYRPDDFPASQVLWPDSQNRFPTDPACSPRCIDKQRLRLHA